VSTTVASYLVRLFVSTTVASYLVRLFVSTYYYGCFVFSLGRRRRRRRIKKRSRPPPPRCNNSLKIGRLRVIAFQSLFLWVQCLDVPVGMVPSGI
jgi:hypothetical protein